MKTVHLWIALGCASGLLVLWMLFPSAEIQEAPRGSKTPRSTPEAKLPQETAPPVDLAKTPPPIRPEPATLDPARPLPPERKARLESFHAARDTWDYLRGIPPGLGDMGREAAIRKTAEHLSIEEGARSAFLDAARQSVLDMEQARVLRSREVSALGVISPAVGNELRSSGERYSSARQAALGRVEPYLGQSPSCQEFRQQFDSWAALVESKGQGPRR